MDDCLSGASNINQFMALKKEIGELLLRGGMTLHKWCSSARSESDLNPFNYCEKQSTVKTLGMMWNNCEDAFLFDISTSSTTEFTKRDVQSQIARLFDPLGLLGPVISKDKIFLQRLWLLLIDWSQTLLRSDQVLLRTDSTIALSWIDTPPHLLKTFLSNRVAQIQELTKEYNWSHITSKNNPAGLLSRGIDAQFLVNNQFWFQGPDSFNSLNSETELNQSVKYYLSEFKSKDSVCLTVKTSALFDDVICISNNSQKLIRIISLIFRFINKCKKNSKECGAPSKTEQQNAEIYILREVQVRTFGNEIHSLEQCGNVTPNSQLKSLSPFLDSQGILRVGGRLGNSILPYNSKHPILLPAKHKVTDMTIQYYHKIQFHLGPQSLLYNIREKFWLLNGRNLCRKIAHSCVTCFKANPKLSNQKMGDLTEDRVNPNFVFNSVGIDFARPFYIETKLRKRDPPSKIYVCIIICLSTKAIHLDQYLISLLKLSLQL
ncbi:hypothetical protein AVEN_91779-1 [Araneus ventricosus]|uniref:Integrase zinc-binding domain-containing protein n=1 Tax=Araneus ventricosus TaxID=182803 RepID=A0A4Y2IRM2_ARAVE|nr:hypothetical protein AVEN_91779-1 [Araneus ventricosus]